MSSKHSSKDNYHGGTPKQQQRINTLNRKIAAAEKITKSNTKATGNGKNR